MAVMMAGGLAAFGQATGKGCPEMHPSGDPGGGMWTDRNNRSRTRQDLNKILSDHARWLREHDDVRIARPTTQDLDDPLRADLRGAQLAYGHLNGRDLSFANLTGADLRCASLTNARLSNADLTGANLENADLQDADLQGTILTKAELAGANLFYVRFEPKAIPAASGIARAKGLRTLTWDLQPLAPRPREWKIRLWWNQIRAALWARPMEGNGDSMQDLRKALHEAGYLGAEQEVNLAYHRVEQSFLAKVLFDWTSHWGASWKRPLLIAFLLWILCSFLYWLLPRVRPERNTLCRVDSVAEPKTTPILRPPPQAAALFSLMSVLNLGVQGLNPGQWVRLLFRQDHDLQAQGWIRTIAGVQSLLGLGLLTLAAIAILGHPIE